MAQSTITKKSNTKLFSKTITSGDITNTYASVLLATATTALGSDLSGLANGVKASVAIRVGATGMTGASATGLTAGTIYDATITINSQAYPVTFVGAQAATVAALISRIEADLAGADVTVAIYDNATYTYVRVESTLTGTAKTVTYTDGIVTDLADAFVAQTPVAVLGTNGSTRTASMTVNGGGAIPISVVGSACTTMDDLVTELNADINASDLTATLTADGILITYDIAGVAALTFTNTSVTNNVTAGGGLTVGTPVAGADEVEFAFTSVPTNHVVIPVITAQRSGAFLSPAGYKTSYDAATTTMTVSTTGSGTIVAGDLLSVAAYY